MWWNKKEGEPDGGGSPIDSINVGQSEAPDPQDVMKKMEKSEALALDALLGRKADPDPSRGTYGSMRDLLRSGPAPKPFVGGEDAAPDMEEAEVKDPLQATREEVAANVKEAVEAVLNQPWELVVKELSEKHGLRLADHREIEDQKAAAMEEVVARFSQAPRADIEKALKFLDVAQILLNEGYQRVEEKNIRGLSLAQELSANHLANEIMRHRTLYTTSSPEISDATFDSLVADLRSLDPVHPVLGGNGP